MNITIFHNIQLSFFICFTIIDFLHNTVHHRHSTLKRLWNLASCIQTPNTHCSLTANQCTSDLKHPSARPSDSSCIYLRLLPPPMLEIPQVYCLKACSILCRLNNIPDSALHHLWIYKRAVHWTPASAEWSGRQHKNPQAYLPVQCLSWVHPLWPAQLDIPFLTFYLPFAL